MPESHIYLALSIADLLGCGTMETLTHVDDMGEYFGCFLGLENASFLLTDSSDLPAGTPEF